MAVARLAAALARHGGEVTIVALGDTEEAELDEGVRVVYVAGRQRLGLPRGYPRWRAAVAAALRRLEPEVVHGHGLPLAGLAVADVGFAPRLLTVHGNPVVDIRIASRSVLAHVRARLVRHRCLAAVRAVEVVIGVHPEWSLNLPIRPRRFEHIPNIVDPSYYAPRPEPERRVVLYCGGSRRIKGWESLARAWASVLRAAPDASLEIAGWTGAAPELAKQDGSAVVHDWLSGEEMRAAMERASVLVIPSRFEVAPIVIAEAWAAGVPVVATRVGGIPGMAEGAALLVPPDDEAALAATLERALDGGSLVEALVAEGRRRAVAHAPDHVAAAHLRLYAELAGRDRHAIRWGMHLSGTTGGSA